MELNAFQNPVVLRAHQLLFEFFEFSSKVICMLCRYIGNLVENWLELNPTWN